MKKIIILYKPTAETFVFNFYTQDLIKEGDDSYNQYAVAEYFNTINDEAGYNFKLDNCKWMIVDELKLTIA